jgi:hypothetical protein
MNLLLISGLAIILGVGAVLILRRWRGHSADDYVSLAMTLLGTFGGFTLGMLASEMASQGEVAAHVQGILRSAQVSTRNALESVETRIEFADFARSNPGEEIEAVPLGLHLPRTLGTLQQDGALFMARICLPPPLSRAAAVPVLESGLGGWR